MLDHQEALTSHLLRGSEIAIELVTPLDDATSPIFPPDDTLRDAHRAGVDACLLYLEREVLQQGVLGVATTRHHETGITTRLELSHDIPAVGSRLGHLHPELLESTAELLQHLHDRHIAALLATQRQQSPTGPAAGFDPNPLFAHLAGAEGLTKAHPTFRREHVIREIARVSETALTVENTVALADEFLAQEGILLNGAGALESRRFTTNEMLATELRVITHAEDTRASGICQVDPEVAEHVLHEWRRVTGAKRINEERCAVLEFLTTSGNGVDLLIGSAGAGKTNLMEAARDIWGAAGIPVVGTALRPVALGRFAEKTGIPTIPLHALVEQDQAALLENTVVIVDEASCIGTRMLDRLFRITGTSGAKVVLIGDPFQMAADEAAGALAALERRRPDTQHLSGTRRQSKAWERAALLDLRSGDIGTALQQYSEHKRVIAAESADHARETAAAHWVRTANLDPTADPPSIESHCLILAGDPSSVAELNNLTRQALRACGRLQGPELTADSGFAIAAGDDVLLLFTASYLQIQTGTLARVTKVNTKTGAITVAIRSGQRTVVRNVPASYLTTGQVQHAYALTVHDAQALKVGEAIYLVSPHATREEAYTALSRGVHRNTMLVEPSPAALPGQDPQALLVRRLGRSRAARMALDVLVDISGSSNPLQTMQDRLEARRTSYEARIAEYDVALESHRLGKRKRIAIARAREEDHQRLIALKRQIAKCAQQSDIAVADAVQQKVLSVHRDFAELNAIDPPLAKAFGDMAERYALAASAMAGEEVLADHVVIDVGDGIFFEADFVIRHPRGVYVKEVKGGKGSLTRAQRAGHPRLAANGGTIMSGNILDPAAIRLGDRLGPTPVVREIWR
ncbi:MAG: AAA family ATPase [Acidimicrobiia bacterium]